MYRTGRHVATFTGFVRCRRTGHHQRHLAAQNDVCRLLRMRVIGIVRVRPVFPNVSVAKTFISKFLRQRLLVHAAILPKSTSPPRPLFTADNSLPTTRNPLLLLAQKRLRPSRDIGGRRGKGVPSSGEKIDIACGLNHYSGAGPPAGGTRIAPRGPPLGPPCCTV